MKELNIDFSFLKQNQKNQPFSLKKMSNFLKKGYLLNLELRGKCVNNGEGMKKIICELLGNHYFKDTQIPFSAIAADLISGEKVILNEGELFDAVLASSSIPGMFPPVSLDDKILVDGGIVSAIPIETCRSMGANFILAVNVSQKIKRKYEYKNAVDILFRSELMTSAELRRLQVSTADIIINPKVGNVHWSNFSKPEKCIEAGEVAAKNIIQEIKTKLKQTERNWWEKLFY